ncbi:MAG TPA: glycosyltransferase [Candidatus Saccharimonadales bacterium]|nr:glycosyltransferase [Candidatus Saccharimonadales bacterium]
MNRAKRLFSIIIVVKNDRGIEVTLQHLKRLRGQAPFEVVVVDSSRPGALADIEAKHRWTRWEHYPYNKARMTPYHRNRGLELARGGVIIFLDANCVPMDGWLEAIAARIDAGEDIVCGPVLDSSTTNLVHYAPTHDTGKYVDVCTTINVALRREVVERVGKFDTSFAFGQDVDYFWRAIDAGFQIYYDPAVAISHDWGKSKEQLRRAYDYGKARAHLFRKHWATRHQQLIREPHVWLYPLFMLGLPLTYFFWPYPLFLMVPVIKNRSEKPLGLVLHHLYYGYGVLAGAVKSWPQDTAN